MRAFGYAQIHLSLCLGGLFSAGLGRLFMNAVLCGERHSFCFGSSITAIAVLFITALFQSATAAKASEQKLPL